MPKKREPRKWWLVFTDIGHTGVFLSAETAEEGSVPDAEVVPVREVMPEEVDDGKTVHAEESAERTLIREFMEVMQAATDGLTDLVKRHHRAFPLWATKAAASAEGMSAVGATLREVLEVTETPAQKKKRVRAADKQLVQDALEASEEERFGTRR